ncbi:MAG TPA: hypothetical protein VK937_09315 [Candidatus Limnocylindria bacterium]|nr:hypothetical protein [Candidatus Limnocylindria bacterium]
MVKPLLFALCVVFSFGGLSAQTPAWQPSPGHTQVPIWPGAVPDPQPVAGSEATTTSSGKDGLIAGRPVVGVFNVARPTMTVYSPRGNNTAAAVVVFPGGVWPSKSLVSIIRTVSSQIEGQAAQRIARPQAC